MGQIASSVSASIFHWDKMFARIVRCTDDFGGVCPETSAVADHLHLPVRYELKQSRRDTDFLNMGVMKAGAKRPALWKTSLTLISTARHASGASQIATVIVLLVGKMLARYELESHASSIRQFRV